MKVKNIRIQLPLLSNIGLKMSMETYYDVGFSSTVSSKKVVMIFVKLSMPKVEKRKCFQNFCSSIFIHKSIRLLFKSPAFTAFFS